MGIAEAEGCVIAAAGADMRDGIPVTQNLNGAGQYLPDFHFSIDDWQREAGNNITAASGKAQKHEQKND
ncbi:hypothetical protein [Ferrovibrio terrae]|uniref:hypothetical protein n=1 Tax=Ferrovibrio terrae TaxID=2594003 RepID=UPI001FE36818|nr:hypothetical protein [Ferrovibrio terrae]